MSTIRMLSGKPCLAERASDWPWASAAARLRHIAGTAWSSKRYLNIELLKDQQMRGAITALSQCRAPLSPNQMMISPPLESIFRPNIAEHSSDRYPATLAGVLEACFMHLLHASPHPEFGICGAGMREKPFCCACSQQSTKIECEC